MANRLLFFAWIVVTCLGFWQLFSYENTPGVSTQKIGTWPVESHLARDPNLPTLLIFAHPRCPCSKASITELEGLLPTLHGKAKIEVVFYQPKSKDEDWVYQGLWKKSQSLSSVTNTLDKDGIEADLFGATTSGQVFLFSQQGSLIFTGGITSQRGHVGDSLGRQSILSFFESGYVLDARTEVFGCALKNPERSFSSLESEK